MERKPSKLKHQHSAKREDSMGVALSYSPESGAVIGKIRESKLRRSSEVVKLRSQEEAQCEITNKNLQSSSSSSFLRPTTTVEEGIDHLDAAISRNSFKSYSKTFHKHFPEISEMDNLIHVFTCALQKEVLYHGKLYVSGQHLCFHSSVLLKETKVEIHVSTVQVIKKKYTARLVPNGISIITKSGDKYMFGSLRNRDTCFKLLQSVCPQLKVVSANASPQVCSANNSHRLEADTISSYSSQEDSVDNPRVSAPEKDSNVVLSSPASIIPHGQAITSSTQWNSSNREVYSSQENTAVSWITIVTEKIKSLFSMRSSTYISKVLVIYLIIALALLLSSGYIGLRIAALEEQLTTLGAMPELGQQEKYKET